MSMQVNWICDRNIEPTDYEASWYINPRRSTLMWEFNQSHDNLTPGDVNQDESSPAKTNQGYQSYPGGDLGSR